MGGQGHASAAVPPGKSRYPLYRRLGGPQGPSGRMRKISPLQGFDPRTVEPVASSYTDWVIPALHRPVGTLKRILQTFKHFPNVQLQDHATIVSQPGQLLLVVLKLRLKATSTAIFQASDSVSMSSLFFWFVTQDMLVISYRRFGTTILRILVVIGLLDPWRWDRQSAQIVVKLLQTYAT